MSLFQLTFGLNNPVTTSGDINTIALLLTKILFVLGAFLYVLFAVVVTRQIHIMKSTVRTPFSPVVQALGYLHLAFAIMVLILFAMFL